MKVFIILILASQIISINILSQDFNSPIVNPFGLEQMGARSSPALVDIDGDQDLDLFSGFATGEIGYFENTGTSSTPNFTSFILSPFGIAALENNSTLYFADIDNDEDQDILCGTLSSIYFFENVGDKQNPSFAAPVLNPFSINPPSGIKKPYLTDIDNDNDLDLFIGVTSGDVIFSENTGNNLSPDYSSDINNPFNIKPIGLRASPAFADLDGDGDKDLIVGEKSTGWIYYFQNIGTPSIALFDSIGPNKFGLQGVNDDAKPYFGDLDADGDLDLIVGSSTGDFTYFENLNPSGLSESFANLILISPNPANTTVKFQLTSPKLNKLNLLIYNSLGNLMANFIIKYSESQSISVNEWPSGIYFCKFEIDDKINVAKLSVTR